MRDELDQDFLLVGEVAEVRGTVVKVRVYSEANEASTILKPHLMKLELRYAAFHYSAFPIMRKFSVELWPQYFIFAKTLLIASMPL